MSPELVNKIRFLAFTEFKKELAVGKMLHQEFGLGDGTKKAATIIGRAAIKAAAEVSKGDKVFVRLAGRMKESNKAYQSVYKGNR